MIDKPAMVADYAARVKARRREARIRECRLRDDLWAIDKARKDRRDRRNRK